MENKRNRIKRRERSEKSGVVLWWREVLNRKRCRIASKE